MIGEEATDIALIQQRLREISYLGWRNYWVEPAFWDIKGKIAGKPVCELLGGKPCKVTLYASTGEVKTPEQRIEEAEARYAESFRSIKLRVHDFDEAVDIRHVVETAKAIGHKMKIGVDVNQGWRVTIIGDAPLWDLDQAKRFADAGISWLEEPLPMDAYTDLTKLTAYSRVPISGGELHTSGLAELRLMIQWRCYGIFQPDAIFAGGIAQVFEVAKLCREHGLLYSPHTWTNGIGFAVNLQLMAACGFADQKKFEYPFSPPGWTVEARDGILQTPFVHDKGTLMTPSAPGIGVTIEPGALRKFGKRFFVMDRKRLIWYSVRNRGFKVSKEIDRVKKEKARKASTNLQ